MDIKVRTRLWLYLSPWHSGCSWVSAFVLAPPLNFVDRIFSSLFRRSDSSSGRLENSNTNLDTLTPGCVISRTLTPTVLGESNNARKRERDCGEPNSIRVAKRDWEELDMIIQRCLSDWDWEKKKIRRLRLREDKDYEIHNLIISPIKINFLYQ